MSVVHTWNFSNHIAQEKICCVFTLSTISFYIKIVVTLVILVQPMQQTTIKAYTQNLQENIITNFTEKST